MWVCIGKRVLLRVKKIFIFTERKKNIHIKCMKVFSHTYRGGGGHSIGTCTYRGGISCLTSAEIRKSKVLCACVCCVVNNKESVYMGICMRMCECMCTYESRGGMVRIGYVLGVGRGYKKYG